MDKIKQKLWENFKQTGNIGCYLLYSQLTKEDEE